MHQHMSSQGLCSFVLLHVGGRVASSAFTETKMRFKDRTFILLVWFINTVVILALQAFTGETNT